MATIVIELDDELRAYVDGLIESGRYGSTEEVVTAGVRLIQAEDGAFSAEDWAAIEKGLADDDAGKVVDAEELFDRLQAMARQS